MKDGGHSYISLQDGRGAAGDCLGGRCVCLSAPMATVSSPFSRSEFSPHQERGSR